MYRSSYRWRPRDTSSYSYYSDSGRWGSRRGWTSGSEQSGAINTGRHLPAPDVTNTSLRVRDVDLQVEANAALHHTDMYEVTHSPTFDTIHSRVVPLQLVVRRGQAFSIEVEFDREVNTSNDEVKVKFEAGESPRPSNGTSVTLALLDSVKTGEWSCALASRNGSKATFLVSTPASCAIGKWRLSILTSVKVDEAVKRNSHQHKEAVYVLLNPWCEDDGVYTPDDDMREEFILADHGRIYRGTKKQISAKPWNFGQFEGFMLDCVFHLLDKSGISWKHRGNPVHIARKISSIVNSSDEDGVLTGNWSGDYSGGTSPLAWGGSVRILMQFWETKKPVNFGQCWVFSGVTTTVARALGMPARSVTNFASAHDSDGSITIDNYWEDNGDPIDDLNDDSVWNFHVWNDVWMARPDLPVGYGGWQAIDATPQETSDGVYCAGPASLAAIKHGMTNLLYDAPFIFAEVNADKVHWLKADDGEWAPVEKQLSSIGKCISTKKVKSNDRHDVTDQYKYAEGSAEERTAVYQAIQLMGTKQNVYETGPQDVEFDLVEKDFALVGQPFRVTCVVKNKGSEERSVDLTLLADVVYYTGVSAGRIKREATTLTCQPNKEYEVYMVVEVDEYYPKLVDMCNIKISCMARVKKTKQFFCDADDFRLVKPDLDLKVPSEVKVGEDYQLEVTFKNPLKKVKLTGCSLQVEGAGLQTPVKLAHSDVPPETTIKTSVKLKAKAPGQREIIATFDSKQLQDISGSAGISVRRA